jgi:hypothetical protein
MVIATTHIRYLRMDRIAYAFPLSILPRLTGRSSRRDTSLTETFANTAMRIQKIMTPAVIEKLPIESSL